ncbi:hypothetical protein HPB50_015704 [Hyalomma asiaticum]|uniref:Uncharacterized protein n=1 Tax=Hyalomma asiaticum TaxID=266040 RepID=A0ACB7SV29_HYAAI|nr:hypothetical protein HPB50_015704 [Hyalomma asiaticum]
MPTRRLPPLSVITRVPKNALRSNTQKTPPVNAFSASPVYTLNSPGFKRKHPTVISESGSVGLARLRSTTREETISSARPSDLRRERPVMRGLSRAARLICSAKKTRSSSCSSSRARGHGRRSVVDGRRGEAGAAFCCAQNGPIYNVGLTLPPRPLHADRDGHEATAQALEFQKAPRSSSFPDDEDDGAHGLSGALARHICAGSPTYG